MQPLRLWRGAIPDVLAILPAVCGSSWRGITSAGEHSWLGSGTQDKGTALLTSSRSIMALAFVSPPNSHRFP